MNKTYFNVCFVLALIATDTQAASCKNGTTLDEATGHCIRITTGCDGKCKSYYDLTTRDVVIKPNEGVTGDIILSNMNPLGAYTEIGYGGNTGVRNMTIEEGITGLGNGAITGIGSGTLKLPSTIKTCTNLCTYSLGFETIDLSDVKNFQSGSGISSYGATISTLPLLGAYNLKNLIMSEDTSKISLGWSYNEHQFPTSEVQIQCKGEPETCKKLVKYTKGASYIPAGFSISADYYVERDSQGNVIAQWTQDGMVQYAYDSGGNLMKVTDASGRLLWSRKIYTVDEAEKVSKPTKNKFRIRYK